MRARIKATLEREDGFTLVELMVVVSILAVLLLMSLTTYTGAKARGQDSAAKQIATRALQTGRVVYTDTGSYATVDTAKLNAAEGSVSFVDSAVASTQSRQASTNVPDRATTAYIFVAAVWSDAGNCYYVRDWITLGVAYGVVKNTTSSTCTAANATSVTWSTKWA